MSSPHRSTRSTCRLLLAPLLALTVLLGVPTPSAQATQAAPAAAGGGIEDYPDYEPAAHCSPGAKPGAVLLGRWLQRKYGGGWVSISRSCSKKDGGTSEHHEGRAVDWSLDARSRADQQTARALLDRLRATDARGNTDALARRMGIMYVIWDDEIYSASTGYEPAPYLNSGCRSVRRCSATLRHRDHVHLSLTRRAAQGRTSWYLAR